MENKFTVLGIHGADVTTVVGNVIRVRFEVNGKVIDEDLPIPTAKTFEELVAEKCQERLDQLFKEETHE